MPQNNFQTKNLILHTGIIKVSWENRLPKSH